MRDAGVAKLVDALALGASGATHGGSSPLPSTFDFISAFRSMQDGNPTVYRFHRSHLGDHGDTLHTAKGVQS